MNKKVYLCDIEALKKGTNDKYGVSATLVFNKGLTYKELEQVIDEKYFYLSNNNLQEENEKLNNIIGELEKELNIAYKELFPNELVRGKDLIKNIQIIIQELKGEDNE